MIFAIFISGENDFYTLNFDKVIEYINKNDDVKITVELWENEKCVETFQFSDETEIRLIDLSHFKHRIENKIIDSIKTECLLEFQKTYRESTSADLQTFILGMTKFCEKYFNK